MKHEIIIEEDQQHCGKCTYYKKEIVDLHNGFGAIYQYQCLLFKKLLNYYFLGHEPTKPERCGDCKILVENFTKMPELEEEK